MLTNFQAIDLHCHSTYSDGSHSVQDVLTQVANNGGKYIALTDHDNVAGITEARHYASLLNLNLIAGVEISVTWEDNILIHILGLGIDEHNPILTENLQRLRSLRLSRGEKIAKALASIGIENALAGALSYCSNPDSLSRTHFAHWLSAQGYAPANKVFAKYLAPGKAGHVAQTWASLAEAVHWIKSSGGLAVIAHPCRYKLARPRLLKLIEQFKAHGGVGIEVVSSSHSQQEIEQMAGISLATNLLASAGSDFHSNTAPRQIKVGLCPALPIRCKPIYPLLGIV